MEAGIMGTGKSVEYFPHDCNAKDDPKIMLMMAQLGLEAYGIYWILIEYLRDQPGYKAPLMLLDPLSRRYGSSKEKFEAIVTKFSLFEFDDQYFTSPSLVRRMEPMEKKREQQRLNIAKRWGKNTMELPPYNNGNTTVIQSKVKKSKEEKSKEEKNKNKEAFFSSSFLIEKWNDWKNFRKQIKKPYKTLNGEEKAMMDLLKQANNDESTAIAIIQQSIDREWLGFFPLKNQAKQSLLNEDPVQRMIREATEIMNNSEIQKP